LNNNEKLFVMDWLLQKPIEEPQHHLSNLEMAKYIFREKGELHWSYSLHGDIECRPDGNGYLEWKHKQVWFKYKELCQLINLVTPWIGKPRMWKTTSGNVCENCNQVDGDECDIDRAEIPEGNTHEFTCSSWNYGGQ
jgi:hypothetical protein